MIVPPPKPARITAQGGLCSPEDIEKIMSLGIDGVGVGTPFLLVSQATSVDKETRRLLVAAKPEDVYISNASPLEIPFVNLRTSTAAKLCQQKIREYFAPQGEKSRAPELKPGFPCCQHYLCRAVPGFDHPVCMASREYVMHRLAEINRMEKDEIAACSREGDPRGGGNDNVKGKSLDPLTPLRMTCGAVSHSGGKVVEFAETPNDRIHELRAVDTADGIHAIREKYDALRRETLERECICRFLGNAGREEIREKNPSLHYQPECVAVARGSQPARVREPVTICPNSDIGYFDCEYTLFEMMRHLYGTGPRLTPKDKPSAFEVEEKILKSVTC
jgi:hypothetical protein